MENSGIFNRQWKPRPINWSLLQQSITEPEVIAGSCFDTKRVKMAEKPQKNSKELCQNRLVKQRKQVIIFLWVGRVSKTGRILFKQKREAGNIC